MVDASDADVDGTTAAGPTLRSVVTSVIAAIRSRPRAELALVAVPIPTLLVTVSLLPGSDAWRLSLAAEGVLASRWTLWTAFASSFVHTSTTHLVDNVVNYWLLVAVAYPLSAIAGWERRLLYATVVYLAVVPLVSAWATLAVLGAVTNAPAAGFSDVNSALLGYLAVVWFAALATEGRSEDAVERPTVDGPGPIGVDARWALVLVLASLSLTFLAPSGVDYFPPIPAVGGLFAIGAGLAGIGLFRAVGRPRVVGLNLTPARELLYVTGASVAVAGVLGSLVVVPFGSNVYAHLVGYVVGFSVAFLGVVVDG
ncbi:hypothetical protein [Halorubrum sp. DTA98]|uniref:hypothetical protein n=1 Tax=Halorubrum sp. DTA98 TaxID=3402163 RepID=UPI003AB06235